MSAILDVQGVSKTYTTPGGGIPLKVLSGIDLMLSSGSITSLVGLNGSGKSTLLRIIAGLEQATTGNIFLGGELLSSKSDNRIGMMFQEETLLPWRTTLENMEIGLEIQGYSKQERRKTTLNYMEAFGLSRCENKYPRALSGGMLQKVAIARTLIPRPQLVLMDEPFSALDCETRRGLQKYLLRIWAERKDSILFVTHNIEEALLLSDVIVVMTPKPSTIREVIRVDLQRPRNPLSSRFGQLRQHILNELKSMSEANSNGS